ncbi:MAG: response regulator transcription factor [Acidimicrobiaceae bacterium]|nr:response regulator transcription factor [Acidimicrobiaceae bacterium]MBO0747247.1 response regulator transcription factor [Acidimicrobiaceae bacterium]
MTPAALRTLVAEGDTRVRQILVWLLMHDPRFEVVGSVGTGGEAARWPGPIDAALVDMAVPGLDAFQAVRALRERHPGIIVLIVATVDGPYFRAAAREAGADGYVDRSSGGANPVELLAGRCFGAEVEP